MVNGAIRDCTCLRIGFNLASVFVMGPLEIAEIMLSRAQQRVELSAQNMANIATPGFKAHRRFHDLIATASIEAGSDSNTASAIDFTSGKLQSTGDPYNLALSGSGFFVVRSDNDTFYTRDGQFHRDVDGRLLTADGLALQSDAGDVVLKGADLKVLTDGTVLDGGQPAFRLAIADTENKQILQSAGGGAYAAPAATMHDVGSPIVRQGVLEASNVSTADEMISIMAALRAAESGQRVVQVYDDLMGRALTAFGQA
jgi:flagellar basal-body rod protein FlgF